jgi:7-cyano-7-deazaguanine synthase
MRKKKAAYLMAPKIDENAIVILNSGGYDSLITLAAATQYGYGPIHSLFVNYGQPAADNEALAAAAIAAHFGAIHHTETINFNIWADMDAMKDPLAENSIIPNRNFVLFAIAASYCDTLMVPTIGVGWDGIFNKKKDALINAVLWDAHKPFLSSLVRAYDQGSRLGWVGGYNLSILAPLLNKTKIQNGQFGLDMEVPFELSWSCFAGGRKTPCGACVKCKERDKIALSLEIPNRFDYDGAISLVPALKPKPKRAYKPRKKKEANESPELQPSGREEQRESTIEGAQESDPGKEENCEQPIYESESGLGQEKETRRSEEESSRSQEEKEEIA